MLTASYQDVHLAARQGTIADITLVGITYGGDKSSVGSLVSLVASILFTLMGGAYLWKVRRDAGYSSLEEALVSQHQGELA